MDIFKTFIRPLLFKLEPETAHNFATSIAQISQAPLVSKIPISKLLLAGPNHPELELTVFDRSFRSPLGLAAGFDKHGNLAPTLEQLGFGFVEFGSITNCASNGNPLPRLFRLEDDKAIINRLGLNNPGPEKFLLNIEGFLKSQSTSRAIPMRVGINVAKTHSPSILGNEAIEDIQNCYKTISESGAFHVLNISCPNTKEGKTFEDEIALADLLDVVNATRPNSIPLLVKFSSDLELEQIDSLLKICDARNISGYVLSNTSSKRANLKTSQNRIQSIGAGGLSGPPIFEKSLANLAHLGKTLGGSKVLIGLGGIDSATKAYQYIKAGASLVEIYTALIYHGPGIVRSINSGLVGLLKQDGFSNISEAIGADHQ